MTDMSSVIVPRSDQVNADDFVSGARTYTIEGVAISPGTEQPVSIRLSGEERVWRPCKSMSRVLVAAWGPDAKAYTGRSLTLYRDPTVTWAGLQVGGIRISHMSHLERDHTMALTVTRQSRKPFTVRRLTNTPPPSERPAESASAPTEPEATTAAGKAQNGRAKEARDRFMAALKKCKDLGEAGELDHKLGASTELLGDYYLECAAAMQAKVDELKGPPADEDHHDAFAELEPEEWKNAEGRVEDDRQADMLGN